MEQVILAFEGEKTANRIKEVIENASVAECLLCHSSAEVKRLVNQQHITTVLCGYKLSDETAEALCEDLPSTCSVLVIAVQGMLEMIDRNEIFKLAAPVRRNDLLASVRMLLQLGHRAEKYVRPQRSMAEKAIIQQAKQVLMDRHGMSEEQAHRFLQKRSMDAGAKMVQTAQMVLEEA